MPSFFSREDAGPSPYREPARRQTRYLRLCLDVLTMPSRCTFPWELMDGDGCTRACSECSRDVHDVSAMSAVDAESFLVEHLADAPKLQLFRRPDGRVTATECPRSTKERRSRRIVSAVAVALALSGLVALVR